MPKSKTCKSAGKRYKVLKYKRYMRRHAFKGHLLEKKSSKRKRGLTGPILVSNSDAIHIRRMLVY